jgi:hypothetical protein
MKVETKVTPVIVGPNRLPIVEALEIIKLKVAETLTAFKPEF